MDTVLNSGRNICHDPALSAGTVRKSTGSRPFKILLSWSTPQLSSCFDKLYCLESLLPEKLCSAAKGAGMADEKKVTHWGAIIGLATGVVALVTAIVTLNQMLNDQRKNAEEQRIAFEQQRERDKAEFDHQRELQQKQIADAAAAQERLARCNRHQENARAIDGDFDTLYREHGQLMSAMRSCTREKPDNQAGCGITVCAVAAWWTNGESNCIDVASQVDAIKQRALSEKQLATADSCEIGESAAATYFN
jgi:hypothetical protein